MKFSKSNLQYATLVWLFSALISPVIMMICFTLFVEGSDNSFYFTFIIMIVGLVLSIPNWLLLILAVQLINQQQMTWYAKKMLLQVIALSLTILLLYGFSYSINSQIPRFTEVLGIGVFYMITLSAGIWGLQLNKEEIKEQDHPDILDEKMF